MKTLSWKAVVFSLVMPLSVVCCGQGVGASREADHQMLRALREKATAAINARDVKALAACFTKPFALTTIDQTTITTEEQLRDYFVRMFDSPSALISEMNAVPEADVLTQFLDDHTGYCYGSSVDTYKLKRGIVSVIHSRWTATLVKQNGEWRIAAAHAGVNLLDNPVLSRSLSASRTFGGVGLGVGLLLGLVIMAILKRQKKQ